MQHQRQKTDQRGRPNPQLNPVMHRRDFNVAFQYPIAALDVRRLDAPSQSS